MKRNMKKRVNITLSEAILDSIDTHARCQGLSRSAYITKLELNENRRLEKYIKENQTYYYNEFVAPDNNTLDQ